MFVEFLRRYVLYFIDHLLILFNVFINQSTNFKLTLIKTNKLKQIKAIANKPSVWKWLRVQFHSTSLSPTFQTLLHKKVNNNEPSFWNHKSPFQTHTTPLTKQRPVMPTFLSMKTLCQVTLSGWISWLN